MNILPGMKTYALSALAVIWTLVYIWRWPFEMDIQVFLTVLSLLTTGTVWAGRAALEK